MTVAQPARTKPKAARLRRMTLIYSTFGWASREPDHRAEDQRNRTRNEFQPIETDHQRERDQRSENRHPQSGCAKSFIQLAEARHGGAREKVCRQTRAR